MSALILSIATLAVGPLLLAVVGARRAPLALLEGLILATIGGLVLLDILPHTVSVGGWLALAAALVGALAPEIVERSLHRGAAGRAHLFVLVLALIGLLLHELVDGMTLSESHLARGGGHEVALAVILHRIPVGLTVWWLLRPHGSAPALGVLAGIALATLGGYGLGAGVLARVSSAGLALFQALVSGSLLHVLWHQPHAHADPSPAGHGHAGHAHTHDGDGPPHGHPRWTRWTLLGALLGALLVGYLLLGHRG